MTTPPDRKNLAFRPIPRRRMIRITAAACAAPFFGRRGFANHNDSMPMFEWRGAALGVAGRIAIRHPDPRRARATLRYCVSELGRLDRIFSLYDSSSELVQLNRSGRLERASLDLRLLLAESQRLGTITDGAFDVTVQPIWRLYADHFRASGTDPDGPSRKKIDEARRRIGFRRIDISGGSVGFLSPGMSVTMNGIAQGYIDDRIADILRNEGFDHALIDLGEIRCLAGAGDSDAWRVAIAMPAISGVPAEEVQLADGALATSSGHGALFGSGAPHHHIFDPATGLSAALHRQVSVISRRATLSDALATALTVIPANRTAEILASAGGERALLVPHRGPPTWYAPARNR